MTGRRQRDVFDRIALQMQAPREVVLEEFGERAAIREYLGGMTKAAAEREAIADVEAILAARHQRLPF